MTEKTYITTNGLTATLPELIEMCDKYTINEFNDFYFGIFDQELKEAIRPYFLERMLAQGGLKK